eukprot:2874410-Alexandrium_andersonii.AAC.1
MADENEFKVKLKDGGGESNQAADGGGGIPESPSSELRDGLESGHEEGTEKVVQGTFDRLDVNHVAEKDEFRPKLKGTEG